MSHSIAHIFFLLLLYPTSFFLLSSNCDSCLKMCPIIDGLEHNLPYKSTHRRDIQNLLCATDAVWWIWVNSVWQLNIADGILSHRNKRARSSHLVKDMMSYCCTDVCRVLLSTTVFHERLYWRHYQGIFVYNGSRNQWRLKMADSFQMRRGNRTVSRMKICTHCG